MTRSDDSRHAFHPEIVIRKRPAQKSVGARVLHFLKLAFLGYFLNDSVDPHERPLLWKLDVRIMPFLIISYWLKVMDAGVQADAFSAGVQIQFGFYGVQQVYLNLLYSLGYGIFEVPIVLLAARMRPSRIISALEIVEGLMSLVAITFSLPWHWYIWKFFMGVITGATFPIGVYMISCWYSNRELAKRMALFTQLPSLLTNIKTAIETPMQLKWGTWPGWGFGGLSLWKWFCIVPFIFSVALGILGFFILPDYPENTNTAGISDLDKKLATERVKREGRQGETPRYTWAIFKRTLSAPDFYLCIIIFTAANYQVQKTYSDVISYFNPGNDVLSIWTNEVYAPLQWIFPLLGSILSDLFTNRSWFIIIPTALGIIQIAFYLASVPSQDNWRVYMILHPLVMMSKSGAITSNVLMAWTTEIFNWDNGARAFTIGAMSSFRNIVLAIPNYTGSSIYGPRYTIYETISLLTFVLTIIATLIEGLLLRRRQHREARDLEFEQDIDLEKDEMEGWSRFVIAE